MELKTKPLTGTTVSDIVRTDYRTADVFKKFGINYCCGGKLPLEEACLLKGVDYDLLQQELQKATKTIRVPNNLPFDEWKLSFLMDYIVNVHHAYIKSTVPQLLASFISFAESHKKKYPGLTAVVATFEELATAVITYNQYKEEVIFPYIKQIENTHSRKEVYGSLFIRTLRKPLSIVIEKDLNSISQLLIHLQQQSQNYTFPEQACTNYQVIFHKLREFDNDLAQQVYLENNILYPKALEKEQELLQL